MITKYGAYCLLCGLPRTEVHHLIMGTSGRKMADEDGLTIPLCNKCHREMHENGTANRLSKVLGQMAWERDYYAKGGSQDARESFRSRYGRSYL